MKLKLYISSLFLLLHVVLYGTHNRAGEITYRHISDCTYEITIVTYTYTLSLADRSELEVSWGDNSQSLVQRIEKVQLANEYYFRNVYVGTHTYPGPGVYRITMLDENRNYGVSNIPNSVMEPFTLQTIIKVTCDTFSNQAPIMLYPPIDKAKVNQLFIHNPSAWDPDGDSLSYKLSVCLGRDGLPIEGYTLPYASNSLTVNAITGDLIWENPVQTGVVNVAMMIEEWRNGVKISQILRDIQIEVFDANNLPPTILPINDLCVEVGQNINFTVTATDPNNDQITLSATGGPFQVSTPAHFPSVSNWGSVSQNFTWNTQCFHVRRQPYHVLFRAKDNSSELSLVSLKNVYITIVAPAPKNVSLQPTSNSVSVTWDPDTCTQAIGYDIYRKTSASGWNHSDCETGVPAYTGFVKIGSTQGYYNTSFFDNNNTFGLALGYEYCYRVVSIFPDGAESYSSDEICTELVKGIPVITHVSVRNTDNQQGSMLVGWSKPTEFDTIAAPGPYKYLIYRSMDLWGQNFALIDSLSDINDTIYIDSLINTRTEKWSYRIDFYNDQPTNRFLIGQPHIASSPFLVTVPDDEKLHLSVQKNVPWINYRYDIYRQNPITLVYDSIGFSNSITYTDSLLRNGTEYCYKIRTTGEYLSGPFINPLLNWSQVVCNQPADTTPPCQPQLIVRSMCDSLENVLNWQNPNHYCANDVVSYNIYYTNSYTGAFTLIATINNPNDTSFIHENIPSLAGCYYVSAVDSFFNESPFSGRYCVDECFNYELPNIFSPDGSDINDLFRPGKYDFVEKVNMQIFNRWGHLVYQTDNPDILWDGTDMGSKKPVTEGVYYYICDVYENRLTGLEVRNLTGFITLVRTNSTNINQ